MEWSFTGEVIEWRGPAPYLFVAMTPDESEDLKEAARGLIYWGQVPVHVTIGDTEFTTALFPRDGRYLVPVKVAVQQAEAIGEGAIVRSSCVSNPRAGNDGARRRRQKRIARRAFPIPPAPRVDEIGRRRVAGPIPEWTRCHTPAGWRSGRR